MDKNRLAYLIRHYGDAIVNYRAANSGKLRYIVCTLDFNNKYIKSKGEPVEKTDNLLLVFAWDADSFKHIDPANVTSVQSLASELRNPDPRA